MISTVFLTSCKKDLSGYFLTEKDKISSKEKAEPVFYKVKWVSDGDTFWVDDGTENGLKIRMTGIDAPESVDYGDKFKEDFGMESHAFADSVLKGQQVRLEFDIVKFDKFGRTLAYVFLPDSTFVNELMVSEGYAVKFNYAPNLKYAEKFIQAEDLAYKNQRGLWKNR